MAFGQLEEIEKFTFIKLASTVGWRGFSRLLISCYDNEALSVRKYIVDAMARIPGASSTAFLKKIVVEAEEPEIKWLAMNSLTSYGTHISPQTVAFFLQILESPGYPDDVYRTAIYGVSCALWNKKRLSTGEKEWMERAKRSSYYHDENVKSFLAF